MVLGELDYFLIQCTNVNSEWIKDLNAEIDMVLKYAPKLREALLCKKDCVLSADHFSKEFLNFTNILSSEKEDLFNRRMIELKAQSPYLYQSLSDYKKVIGK